MTFEQATIKVEKEQEFQELRSVIDRAFSAETIVKFLKRLGGGLRARDFDAILTKGVFDQVCGKPPKKAGTLYQALSLSDQAQIREFYLSRVEEVSPELRTRFHKVFQYY